MNIINASGRKKEIVTLLESAKLPVTDLPHELDDFLTVLVDDVPVGVAGVELYGEYALLRSVMVLPAFREKGLAGGLLISIEKLAADKGVKTLYLLTETAEVYFCRKGYKTVSREEIPDAVKQSSEFSYVCPQSAIAMKKDLG